MDQEIEILQLGVSDIRNARNMYLAKSTQANKIANNIMRFNLPAIVSLIAANGLVIYYIENPAVAVAIGNVIGASISVMWQERQQVVGFFFGSSIGSQEKTELMVNKQ